MCAAFVQKSVERIVWKKKIYFPLFPNRSNFLPCVTSGWIKDYSTFVLLSCCTTKICMMHLLLTFMGMVCDPPMYAQLGNGETPWSHFLKSKYICKQRKSIFCATNFHLSHWQLKMKKFLETGEKEKSLRTHPWTKNNQLLGHICSQGNTTSGTTSSYNKNDGNWGSWMKRNYKGLKKINLASSSLMGLCCLLGN